MPLNKYWVAVCDECFEDTAALFGSMLTKAELISEARAMGWTIGKRVLCDTCRAALRKAGL